MKKWKTAIKIICFICIFAALFLYVQEMLRDKWAEGEYNVTTKVRGFYAEEENTLDVIFVGSSQMYADMSPAVLFQEYGITSYDFCANEQPLWISYYYIKEALKHQDPKVIVLDVFTIYGEDYEEEGITHINLDDMPISWNKIMAIRDSVPAGMRYSYYFPLAKYHNTWTDFYEGKARLAFYDQADPYKGYSPFVFAAQYEESAKEEVANQIETEPIPERAEIWLRKIIALCQEENVPLVLIKTPNGNAERQKLYNSVEIIADETNTPFFNMNVLLDGQAHINVLQAEKVSKMMGAYLIEHYSFEDKRNDPDYERWVSDSQLFYRQKAKCLLISAQNYEEYVSLLADENYVVCISAKNSGKTAFSQENIAFLNDVLGLQCRLDEDSEMPYAAVIAGGEVLYETTDGSEGPIVVGVDTDGLHIEISSPGSMTDHQSASIVINGTDFSMDCDGLNIAVYDKVLGEMFEMSLLDVTQEMQIIRK
ncbi:MAG: hypothetical protein ACI4AA_10340 [Lachnospiraceae bacterium]